MENVTRGTTAQMVTRRRAVKKVPTTTNTGAQHADGVRQDRVAMKLAQVALIALLAPINSPTRERVKAVRKGLYQNEVEAFVMSVRLANTKQMQGSTRRATTVRRANP